MKLRMSLLTGAMALALAVPAAAQYGATTSSSSSSTSTSSSPAIPQTTGDIDGGITDRATTGSPTAQESTTAAPGATTDPTTQRTRADSPTAREVRTASPRTTANVTAGVNLRTGPGIDNDSVTVIPQGTAVNVQGCDTGWCEVSVDGMSGFVSERFMGAGVADAPSPTDGEVLAGETMAGETLASEGLAPRTGGGTTGDVATGDVATGDVATGDVATSDVATGDVRGETTTALAFPDEGRAQTTSDLNLRAGPGIEHDRVGVIPEGATVDMQGCQSGWCQVTYAGMTGYASNAYLDAIAAQQTFALAPLPHEQNVAKAQAEAQTEARGQTQFQTQAQATSDLNLRAGAGMEHSPIGVIPQGAAVEIRDCIPDRVWCEVSYGDMTGYASELYLDLS